MKWKNKGHEFDEYWEKIKDVESVYLFGAGINGKAIYKAFKNKINIIGFIDNDKTKCGDYIEDKKIDALEKINLREHMAIIITVSPDLTSVISNQLISQGKRSYDMHTFFPIYSLYKYNEVFLTSISYLPTTVCNLNCRCCLNFSPYLKRREFRNISTLQKDIDLFFSKIDFLLLMHISGGEPFLYPELSDLFLYIADNYGTRIQRLETTTNGTIIPSDKLCTVLRDTGINVVVDDYREAVPEYSGNFNKIILKLQQFKISYRIQKVENWIDLHPVTKKHEMTEQQLREHFNCCNVPWQEYRNGKLFLCNYSAYASVAGLYEVKSDEYFDLRGVFKNEELVEFRLGYSKKGYVDFCQQCEGYYNNCNIVKPAEQFNPSI